MTRPEKYYRFRALNEGPGFRRTRKATAYKKGSERLIGRGLCAAMTMRWLEDGTVPTAFEEFATLQDFYSRTLDEMDNENYATTALAKKCHLTVTGVWPEIKGAKSDNDYLSKCIAYWQDSHFQTAISQYVAGELTTGQTLPCQVGFYVNTKVKVKAGKTVDQEDIEEFESELSGAHAGALKAADGGGYLFYDPNAGEYQIDDDDRLEDFFATLRVCYESFYKPEIEKKAANPQYVFRKATCDLLLVGFWPVQPR